MAHRSCLQLERIGGGENRLFGKVRWNREGRIGMNTQGSELRTDAQGRVGRGGRVRARTGMGGEGRGGRRHAVNVQRLSKARR